MTTPQHAYATIAGTEPVPHGTHEPRTIKHAVTDGTTPALHMMSEIGDGIFVQWSLCDRCSNRIGICVCASGPIEPAYITKWRDDRFQRSLNERPNGDFTALPSVLKWLRSFGYVLVDQESAPDFEPAEYADTEGGFDTSPQIEAALNAEAATVTETDSTTEVDAGLDDAMARVRALQQGEPEPESDDEREAANGNGIEENDDE